MRALARATDVPYLLNAQTAKADLTGVPFILLVARVDEFTLTWLGENPKVVKCPRSYRECAILEFVGLKDAADKLPAARGVSAIWVTHRIEDVRILASKHACVGPGHRTQIDDEGERCCLANTRVVMLHNGRIIFEGPDELFWKSNDPVIREFVEYDTALQ